MAPVLAVDARDVTKTYGALRAVDGVSIRVAQGEVYGVLGPNGAGKTTFLRMLFGLIAPDAGTIELFGRRWERDGMRTLESVAGFIESPKFYPYLTGRENLQGMARLDGGGERDRIDEVLQVVDLAGATATGSGATPSACVNGALRTCAWWPGDTPRALVGLKRGRGPRRSVATKQLITRTSTRWTVVRAARARP